MKRALAVCLLLLAACSGDEKPIEQAAPTQPTAPPPPSAQQAHGLIASSPDFGEYEFTNAAFTMPVSGAAMNEPQRIAAQELSAAGWITLDGNGDVALNEKSRNDKRFLLRANGLLDIVPLAKKEMGEVTAVRQSPDGTVTVDFTWTWIANEVGRAFNTGLVADRFATVQDGRAMLMWDGTGWTILSIQ